MTKGRSDRTTSERCECGARKKRSALCCDRCSWLDFGGRCHFASFEIVQAMRESGGAATQDQLVNALKKGETNVYMQLQRLVRNGRITKRTVDGDVIDGKHHGRHAHVYTLAGAAW